MFFITKATLTGSPDASGWAQVHDFLPEEAEKRSSRGHLFAVVATGKGEIGVDSVAAGREVLSRLHEEYFGDLTQTPFNALRSAISAVITEFSETWGNVEISATALVNDVVYSAAGGGAEVSVFRNGMLAKILSSKTGEVASASGYPKEKDLLILGTKLFFEAVPGGVIKAALESFGPEEAVESLAPNILSRPNSGNLGLIFIKFGKEKEETQAPPILQTKKPSAASVFSVASASAAGFFEKAVAQINRLIARRWPERKIYVQAENPDMAENKSKKVTLTVGIVLLALLIISIGFGIRQKKIKEQKAVYESSLILAQQDFNEALSLYSSDESRARELFVSAKTKVDEILAKGIKDAAVTDLNQKLEVERAQILGEYREEPQVFVDLSLLSEGLKGDKIVAGAANAYILDIAGKKVVSVSVETKKTAVISGPDQISEAQEIAAYEDRVFILSSKGVFEIGDKNATVLDKNWSEPALLYAYSGNIYILDKTEAQIYRYAGLDGNISEKNSWLSADVTADFSKITNWAIDGAIWLLSSSGKISKFALGSAQDFSMSGVYPEITAPAAIYTDSESQGFYVLEPAKNRVVVLDKNGKYLAQYVAPKISETMGLIVSEANKRIILLAGSKLYSLEIKHAIE